MKLELEVKGRRIGAFSLEALADAQGFGTVLDLRKAHEITEDLAPGFKERQVVYNLMPVTAETLSEQDLDHLRLELARDKGPWALVSTGGRRAAALLLMHAGRSLGWSPAEAVAKCPELAGDKALSAHVESYITRHQDKSARHWSQEALGAPPG